MNNNPYMTNLGYGSSYGGGMGSGPNGNIRMSGAPQSMGQNMGGPQSMGNFGTPGVQAMPPQSMGMGGAQIPPAPWRMGGMHGPHNFDPNGMAPMGSYATGGTQPYNPMGGSSPMGGAPMGGSNGGYMNGQPSGGPRGYGNGGGLLGGWR